MLSSYVTPSDDTRVNEASPPLICNPSIRALKLPVLPADDSCTRDHLASGRPSGSDYKCLVRMASEDAGL